MFRVAPQVSIDLVGLDKLSLLAKGTSGLLPNSEYSSLLNRGNDTEGLGLCWGTGLRWLFELPSSRGFWEQPVPSWIMFSYSSVALVLEYLLRF